MIPLISRSINGKDALRHPWSPKLCCIQTELWRRVLLKTYNPSSSGTTLVNVTALCYNLMNQEAFSMWRFVGFLLFPVPFFFPFKTFSSIFFFCTTKLRGRYSDFPYTLYPPPTHMTRLPIIDITHQKEWCIYSFLPRINPH